MGQITTTFECLRRIGRTALMPYLTMGYPQRESALALVPALVGAGADLVELGVPFGDPLADGATIQASSQQALANGMTLTLCLEQAAALRGQDVTGLQAQKALQRANIVCNKNAIPFDPLPPAYSSGIRLGTPAATTRGFCEPEIRRVGQLIAHVVGHIDDDSVIAAVREEVLDMCRAFPIPV